MSPVLGRIVEATQQLLGVVGDLGHHLGPLDAVVAGKDLDGVLGVVTDGASRISTTLPIRWTNFRAQVTACGVARHGFSQIAGKGMATPA
jgi:hypothetical protein